MHATLIIAVLTAASAEPAPPPSAPAASAPAPAPPEPAPAPPEPAPAPAQPAPEPAPAPAPAPAPPPAAAPVTPEPAVPAPPPPAPKPIDEPAPRPAPKPKPAPKPPPEPEPEPPPAADTGTEREPARQGPQTVIVPWTTPPQAPSLLDLLPPTPRRGTGPALGLVGAAIGLAAVGGLARSLRGSLRDTGVLPSVIGTLAMLARLGAGVAVLGAVLAVLPEALLPAVPFAAIALAVALGWSARDALPDLVAWGFLVAEGRVRQGMWVRGEGFAGRVERVGLRATWIVDARDGRTAVPNRLLLARPLSAASGAHPLVEVSLALPGVGPEQARAALAEAALLSPWIAPGGTPEVGWDPERPERWWIRIRLVDGRFEDRFAGTFPERVHEVLGRGGG